MATRIQLRRATAAQWTAANPVLTSGEPGLETDTGVFKWGNGVTAWNSLPAASSGGTATVDASPTTKGISRLSSAPASPTAPIAVGDNDSRVANVEHTTQKGAASGYAPLDSTLKVPAANLPAFGTGVGALAGYSFIGTTPDRAVDASTATTSELLNLIAAFYADLNVSGGGGVTQAAADLRYLLAQAPQAIRSVNPIGYAPASAWFEQDHFASGSSSGGSIGRLGWVLSSANVPIFNNTAQAAAGRLGVGTFNTAAAPAANLVYSISLRSTSAPPFSGMDTQYHEIWVSPVLADASVQIRVGLSSDPASATPSNAIYVEKLFADTDWFGVSVGASAGYAVRTPSLGVVSTTGYVKIRVRRSGSTVYFSIDGGITEVSLTTNLPSTTSGLNPFVHLQPSASTQKSILIDYYEGLVTGLTS